MQNNLLAVNELLDDVSNDLSLKLIEGFGDVSRNILNANMYQPGLTLAGFGDDIPSDTILVFGDPECAYLKSLNHIKCREILTNYFSENIPCLIISGQEKILSLICEIAADHNIPLISTSIPLGELTRVLSGYLSTRLAPSKQIHGTLVDVYGTGVLFIGQAGIGKSEIALDLVERGHRLVADDIVILKRQSNDVIIGSGPEMLIHMIEIRGVGIINIREIFGVRAVRLQKRVEIVVELKEWDENENYERLGLEDQSCNYLGIGIPLIRLPIFPGKNITVISEAIALNFHLKVYGYHAAKDLSDRLVENLNNKRKIREYLQEDSE